MNLKENGKVFTSKFVGTGPSSYEKKNLPGRGLTNIEKHWTMVVPTLCKHKCSVISFSAEEFPNPQIYFKNETVAVTIFAVISGLM